jgi:phage gp45-like
MTEISAVQSQSDRLYRRMLMGASPVLLTSIDDSGPVQIAQVRINDTPEIIDNMPVAQLYGISTVAPTDPNPSDALAVFITGQRSNGVIVATNNQQYRLQNQQPGETSLYTDEGDTIGLNRGNIINVKSKNTVNVNGQNQVNTNTATATVNASSQINHNTPLQQNSGDIKAKGIIDAAGGFFSNGLPIGGGAGEPGPPGDPGPPGPPGPTAVSADMPNMATIGSDSLIFVRDAPSDGNEYVRVNTAWVIGKGGGAGIPDAPSDGYAYIRASSAWASGGTLNAPLILAGDPTLPLGAVTKQYSDLKAPLASPAFTGTPTAPTAPANTANGQIATTFYVDRQTDLLAPIASPAFSGAPTAPTPAIADNSTRIATTAWVLEQGFTAGGPFAPLNSPAFTGIPTGPTAPIHTANSQFATTLYTDRVTDLLAPLASPTFTGTPIAPTAAANTANGQIATTLYVDRQTDLLAPLASPTFTGIPTAPTAALSTANSQVATTLYVDRQADLLAPLANPAFTGTASITGVGTNLHLYANAAGAAAEPSAALYLGGGITVSGVDAGSTGLSQIAYGGVSDILVMRAQGTGAAPLAIDASRILGNVRAGGYDGTNWNYAGCGLQWISGAAWTPTSHPAAIRFLTTPVGATVWQNVGMWQTDGSLYIGSGTSAVQNLTGPGTISCDNGITINAGGLTVNGGGASITGNATVSLMLTATTVQSTGNAIVGGNLTVNGSVATPLDFLNGANSNGPPDTLGTGERLRLWAPAGGPPDYALGIEAAGMWFGVSVNAHFSWYIATTQVGLWNASAGLTLNTALTISSGGLTESGPAVFNGSATFNANLAIAAAGIPTWAGTPAGPNQLTNKSYVDGQNALYLPLAGGTLTGALTISAGGANITGAVTTSTNVTVGNNLTVNNIGTINPNAAPTPQPLAGSVLRCTQVDGTACRINLDSFGTGAAIFSHLALRNARGTCASPTPTQSGDEIGRMSFIGCNTAGGFVGGGSVLTQVRAIATENWTASSNACALEIDTVITGAVVGAKRATFDANFTITGAGYQPGGGSWTATSDTRLKKDVGPYRAGLDAVLQLDPIRFRYNGLGGMLDTETVYYGLAAEDVQPVMPEMVHSLPLKLREEDPEPVDVLHLNTTALTFALVNAVKELSRRLAVLEGRA